MAAGCPGIYRMVLVEAGIETLDPLASWHKLVYLQILDKMLIINSRHWKVDTIVSISNKTIERADTFSYRTRII